jgi:hypothetical protein
MQAWVNEELCALDLGDTRLNDRCVKVVSALAANPSVSIPTACASWGETLAAYRFFDNDAVEPDEILRAHQVATLDRMASQSVVIVAQDTTTLNLTRPEVQVKGAGPLASEYDHGMFEHVGLALTPQGVPVGILFARGWARDWRVYQENQRLTKSEKAVAKRSVPFEDKESYRWLEGYKQGCQAADRCPQTQVIVVSDSEADILDCFAHANAVQEQRQRAADWITRAFQNRRLVKEGPMSHLWDACKAAPLLTTLEIEVSQNEPKSSDKTKRNQPRTARKTQVEVRATQVTVRGQPRIGGALPRQTIHAVYVMESHPPPGEKPVEWLLLTNLDVSTKENAVRVIEYYVLRWKIEIYFRILKVGCGVEELQFETLERFQRCLTIYLIVAWRVNYLMMLGRTEPKLSCENLLAPEEWRSLYAIVRKRAPPKKPPPIGQAMVMVAQLGGYLARRHDGFPGPQATWIGIQRLRDFALAWNAFGPGSRKK